MSEASNPTGHGGPAPRRRVRWNPRPQRATVTMAEVRRGRFVGLIKYSLVGVALSLVVLVVAWPRLMAGGESFMPSFAKLGPEDFQLRMVNARYMGTDARDRPFVITAELAVQDPSDPWRVALQQLQADITMQDGTWLSLTADKGQYHQRRQQLRLDGGISIFSDLGYELQAQDVEVDLAAGRAASALPIRGQGPFGLLRAQNFEITEFGDVIRFGGGVKMTLYPGEAG